MFGEDNRVAQELEQASKCSGVNPKKVQGPEKLCLRAGKVAGAASAAQREGLAQAHCD